jgi:hypothetical protein
VLAAGLNHLVSLIQFFSDVYHSHSWFFEVLLLGAFGARLYCIGQENNSNKIDPTRIYHRMAEFRAAQFQAARAHYFV